MRIGCRLWTTLGGKGSREKEANLLWQEIISISVIMALPGYYRIILCEALSLGDLVCLDVEHDFKPYWNIFVWVTQ